MLVLALSVQVIVFIVIFTVLYYKVPSILHPVYSYSMFHLIVYVIRPIFVYVYDLSNEWNYFGVRPSDGDVSVSLFLSSLAYAIFCLICVYVSPQTISWSKRPFGEPDKAEKIALTICWIILGPLALYSAYNSFVHDSNYLETFNRTIADVPIYTDTSAYLDQAHNFLAGLCLLVIVASRFHWLSFGPFFAFASFRLFTGSRFGVVLAAISLIFIVVAQRRARFLSLKEIAGAAVLFIIFSVIGNNRYFVREMLGYTNIEAPEAAELNSVAKWLDKPDFANLESLAFVVRAVPDLSHTYSYFSEESEVFTRPIPRVLWPNKPVGPPIQLVDLNDFGVFTTRSPGMVGVGWMGLGIVGVVLYTSLTAYVMGRLHNYVIRNRYRTEVYVIYSLISGVFIIFLRDGYILSAILYTFWTCTPIFVWGKIKRWMRMLIPPRAKFGNSPALHPKRLL